MTYNTLYAAAVAVNAMIWTAFICAPSTKIDPPKPVAQVIQQQVVQQEIHHQIVQERSKATQAVRDLEIEELNKRMNVFQDRLENSKINKIEKIKR